MQLVIADEPEHCVTSTDYRRQHDPTWVKARCTPLGRASAQPLVDGLEVARDGHHLVPPRPHLFCSEVLIFSVPATKPVNYHRIASPGDAHMARPDPQHPCDCRRPAGAINSAGAGLTS